VTDVDDLTDAAPAPPTPDAPPVPAATTAVEHALVEGNYPAYRDAKRAEASGKPLPAPVAAAPAVTPTPKPAAPAGVSKRQQQINDYERRIAEQAAEITRLSTTRPAAAPRSEARPEAAAPAPASPQDYERYLAMPEAPKQESFDTYDKFSAAMAVFIADQRFADRDRAAQQRADADRQTAAHTERTTKFSEAIKAVVTTDPKFLESVSADVLALKPFAALAPGEPGGPLNAIAEELLDSAVAPQLMQHFSAHPEDLQRLAQLAPRDLIREFTRLEGRFERPAAAPPPKTVSDAPPPPQTLGTRPADPADPVRGAVMRGDFAAYRAAKRAQQRT
jgi:hypothetical protein